MNKRISNSDKDKKFSITGPFRSSDYLRIIFNWPVVLLISVVAILGSCKDEEISSVKIPFTLDHNRMLIEAEFQRADGSWRKAKLWVDTGNPEFFISKELAEDIGIELKDSLSEQAIEPPSGVRIAGMNISFEGIKCSVDPVSKWLFNAIHNDGNLPSTVLQKYHIIFNYPTQELTIAEPGKLKPQGIPSPVSVNKTTGIIQMDAMIDGEKYSFAFDNGASFSYVPDFIVSKLLNQHPEWPSSKGAVGCANIWGWWPDEGNWPMIRIPEIRWGTLNINNAVICGLPSIFRGRTDIGVNYSKKTARPVNGFFGPNIFMSYRIEIIYSDSTIYFEKLNTKYTDKMDIVGLTLKQKDDNRYTVIGIANKDGKPLVDGIEKDDIILQIENINTTGATMGTVVDALRGKPGDLRLILHERNGETISTIASVKSIL